MSKDSKKISSSDLDAIKRLAEEADANKGFELGFEENLVSDDLDLSFIDDKQDPDKSYQLYYAIEGILRTHLPKGKSALEIRKIVREEKIIFLTGGKKLDDSGRRNADSRQAYIATHLEPALKVLLDWVRQGKNTFELFLAFRRLNIEYGYFTEEEESDYSQKIKKDLNDDPKKEN